MDLLEYQGKQLFARHGVPVPSGAPATTVEEAVAAAESPEHPVTVSFEHFDGESVEPLQSRLDEGCSVIAGIGTTDDGYGIHVTIRH